MILARVVTLNAGYNAEQEMVINLGWKVGVTTYSTMNRWKNC